uniref:Uncharacterized protein n=1 Tax=Syphacia muris TaxID=451379 RepID=A0A0N5B043_9BILA
MDCPSTSQSTDLYIASLKSLAGRSIAITLFQNNVRWRRLTDVVETLKCWLKDIGVAARLKKQLHDYIGEVINEVQRWNEKHSALFGDEKPCLIPGTKIQRAHRSEHLRTFYQCIAWKTNRYEIDDYKTAQNIIDECSNWPQMQFQFACAYAMIDMLKNTSRFDSIRLRAFSKKLSGHCLYDFWITILSDDVAWKKMFSSDALSPKQKLSLAFQFSILNGYFELMSFIWERVTMAQREYIGILQWSKICFRAKHSAVVEFLCQRLCDVNPNALARITWNSFYDALHKSIENEDNEGVREVNTKKIEFLLEHCCPKLRDALLSMSNYKVVTDAFAYNQSETFALFLDYLNKDQLQLAREFVDRFYDRKKTESARNFRQMVIRRQHTID